MSQNCRDAVASLSFVVVEVAGTMPLGGAGLPHLFPNRKKSLKEFDLSPDFSSIDQKISQIFGLLAGRSKWLFRRTGRLLPRRQMLA